MMDGTMDKGLRTAGSRGKAHLPAWSDLMVLVALLCLLGASIS